MKLNTSLWNYIKCEIDFWFKNVTGLHFTKDICYKIFCLLYLVQKYIF